MKFPLDKIPDSILCPVRAYKAIPKAIPAAADAPLFIMPQNRTVNYSMYQSKLKEYIQKIGKDPNIFSSHSFRRAFATLLFGAKVPADKIKLMGDWRPDAYRKYLSFPLEDKIKVAENMRSFIQKPTVKFSLPMSYE